MHFDVEEARGRGYATRGKKWVSMMKIGDTVHRPKDTSRKAEFKLVAVLFDTMSNDDVGREAYEERNIH